MLIGLAGYQGAGKDTVAEQLRLKYGFMRMRFADPLKQMLARLLEVSVEQLEDRAFKEAMHPLLLGQTPRHAMQTLGTEWGRNQIHRDLWTHVAAMRAHALEELGRRIVFTDVRFPNELRMIHQHEGAVIWVSRRGFGPAGGHSSEHGISPEMCDRIVSNDGTPAGCADRIAYELGIA